MVIVTGTVQIDPSTVDATWAVVEPFIAPSRAEAGNLAYGFYPDPTTPGLFRIHEEWTDQAAFEAHQAMPHRNELMATMGTLGIQAIDLRLHVVGSTTRLM